MDKISYKSEKLESSGWLNNMYMPTNKSYAPELELMCAVLELAVKDYKTLPKRSYGFKKARNYLFKSNNDSDCVFSFESICSHLNLNPGFVRTALENMTKREFIELKNKSKFKTVGHEDMDIEIQDEPSLV